MDDAELKRTLKQLGIDRRTVRALPLLPLVQVAWADGTIQPAEHGLIREIAARYGLEGAELVLLERWIARRPSRAEFARARKALVALWTRDRDRGHAPDNLDGVIRMCHCVARVAGGLFGVAFTFDRQEADAIAEITQALRIGPSPRSREAGHPAPLSRRLPKEPTPAPVPRQEAPRPRRPATSETPTILPPDDHDSADTVPLASLRRMLMDDEETELDLPVLPHPYDDAYDDYATEDE